MEIWNAGLADTKNGPVRSLNCEVRERREGEKFFSDGPIPMKTEDGILPEVPEERSKIFGHEFDALFEIMVLRCVVAKHAEGKSSPIGLAALVPPKGQSQLVFSSSRGGGSGD